MASVPWLAVSKALEVVHELRSCGLDADVDLPRICVAGKQSSGKSSVIEALTGVSVPRSSGTCTRCAFEISTRWAECDFRCTVSIRCELNGTGSKEELALASSADRAELPRLLRLGQQALLHPEVLRRHWDALKGGSAGLQDLEAEISELQRQGQGGKVFSRDVVVVDMHGCDLKNLELIDLPGLIQSVQKDEEKDLMPLIQDLCTSYLRRSNTLIVMCCPMNDDMENQAVRMMAKEHDKGGNRTIGALTKALIAKAGHDPTNLVAPHDQDDAIWCMSAAYAYHKVAFKRFCDVLPRAVDELLLRGFLQSIRGVVLEGLKVFGTSQEGLCEWFEEDEQISKKRLVVGSQLKRLRQGLQHLESVSEPKRQRKG